jgi:hypothetical protein
MSRAKMEKNEIACLQVLCWAEPALGYLQQTWTTWLEYIFHLIHKIKWFREYSQFYTYYVNFYTIINIYSKLKKNLCHHWFVNQQSMYNKCGVISTSFLLIPNKCRKYGMSPVCAVARKPFLAAGWLFVKSP